MKALLLAPFMVFAPSIPGFWTVLLIALLIAGSFRRAG